MGMAFIQWAVRKGMVERRLGSDIFERTSAGTITISSDIVGALCHGTGGTGCISGACL